MLESHASDHSLLRTIPSPSVIGAASATSPATWALDGATAGNGSDLAIGAKRLRAALQANRSSSTPKVSAVLPVKTALLASEERLADALASGALQAHAPLFLTQTNTLEPAVLNELLRDQVKEVWILGGHQAVAPAVEQALRANGITTRRISGADRVETAKAISAEVRRLSPGSTGRFYVARAFGDQGDERRAWADALALGALAANRHTPILLTATEQL